MQPSPPPGFYLLPKQNVVVSLKTIGPRGSAGLGAPHPTVFVGAAVRVLDHATAMPPAVPGNRVAPSIPGRDMGEVMLGEHLGVTAIHGVQQRDVGAPGTPLSSAEFGRVQGSHRSTLCGASTRGQAARGFQQAAEGHGGWIVTPSSELLHVPSATASGFA